MVISSSLVTAVSLVPPPSSSNIFSTFFNCCKLPCFSWLSPPLLSLVASVAGVPLTSTIGAWFPSVIGNRNHAWTNQHNLKWENTTISDGSKNKHILQIKEALHIQLAGQDRLFNKDCGVATSECWRSIMMRHCKRTAPPLLYNLYVLTMPDLS